MCLELYLSPSVGVAYDECAVGLIQITNVEPYGGVMGQIKQHRWEVSVDANDAPCALLTK